MRSCAGLAVLVLALTAGSPVSAQTSDSLGNMRYLPPSIGTASLHTPAASSNAGWTGFSPMNFFHSVGGLFTWPPTIGNSSAKTMVTGPNPFPTKMIPISTTSPFPTSAQMPSMQIQTSFNP